MLLIRKISALDSYNESLAQKKART